MPRNDDISEIKTSVATLVANYGNMKERLDNVIPYIEQGYEHRKELSTDMAGVKSTLNAVKEDLNKYQQDCTNDREDINIRVSTVEKIQARNSGIAAGVSFVFGTLGAIFGSKA